MAENMTSGDDKKWVFEFGPDGSDGNTSMTDLLGGKGANLAEMANIGLPVPPGFTISTDVCTAYYDNGEALPADLRPMVRAALTNIEKRLGQTFGDPDNPLLVSVRSGARSSMPGMMDTVLNLGLNDETVAGLARRADDERFAYDSYRRFIQMYADVVLGLDAGAFEDALENYKNLNGHSLDTDLTADDWRDLIDQFNELVEMEMGEPFPQDTSEQLWRAIAAVFGSWRNTRADTYRRLNNIPHDWGTAVNVQAMVFGNLGEKSATGVAFTRNPSTGAKTIYGEFLVNAQGEDVVAGIRTPQPLTEEGKAEAGDDLPSLEATMPETFEELEAAFQKLESHYRDMQDIEFTIQQGKLWLLQTRDGKRTAEAALNIAVDMAEEGLISKEEAVLRVEPSSLDQLLYSTIDEAADLTVLTKGLPASPGAAVGEIVFLSDEAEEKAAKERKVLLVRTETSPEDIHGMHAAAGILTARGGMTSHAAVVARGMGKPCVAGAGAMRIDLEAGTLKIGERTFSRGDVLTIDGASGKVYEGRAKMSQPELSGAFEKLMGWADAFRTLGVRANADTPADAQTARDFGAEGIGLCRTEHMFFDDERILAMREMIVSDREKGRRAALEKILPMQRDDFVALFKTMAGLPVTIRLLDPPLHEFLPKEEKERASVAAALGISETALKRRLYELKEFNPMLGFRGCRIAIKYPEIPEMQARAIFEAAAIAGKETGSPVRPEVMLPLVIHRKEFDILASLIRKVAREVAEETGNEITYEIGTMVEFPRCVLMAESIASGDEGAAFFSFGTNDLTQTCLGMSRDDAGAMLEMYADEGIFPVDPFVSIDVDGVGAMVRMGTEKGRSAKPDLKVGICGEHGGDPKSVQFCHETGLDYVSCSPFRVPVARLAAAQAALKARSAA